MKKLRIFLALLAGIALLAAFCGGSALAEEKQPSLYYYNGGNGADSLELNFSFGLDLLLRDLETSKFVKAKILLDGVDYADETFPVVEGRATVNLMNAMLRMKTALDENMIDPASVQPVLELYACNSAETAGGLYWKGALAHNEKLQFPSYEFGFISFPESNPENPREIWGADAEKLFFYGSKYYDFQLELNFEEQQGMKEFSLGKDETRKSYQIELDAPLKHGDHITLNITDAEGVHINAINYNVSRRPDAEAADAETMPVITEATPEVVAAPMLPDDTEAAASPEVAAEVSPAPEATETMVVVSPTPSAVPETAETAAAEDAVEPMEAPVDTILEETLAPDAEDAAEEPADEAEAAPAEESAEEPNPEPTEEAVLEPALPEFRLYLKAGDREYDFLPVDEQTQTVIMDKDDELRVVCEIASEADADDLKWQIDVTAEGAKKAESSVMPKGAFDEKGKLKKEDTPYIITAAYNWNNQAGTYRLRILKDAMGVQLALVDAPDQWLADGDTIAAQDADDLLVCALEGIQLKVAVAGEEAQLVLAETAEDAAYAAWKLHGSLPAAGELALDIVDDRGNETGITLNLDPAPEVKLNLDAITVGVESVAGNTEPEAALRLMRGEEIIAEETANERGDFNLALPAEKQLGDTFILQVLDTAGNLVEQEIVIAAEKKDPLLLDAGNVYIINTENLAAGIIINGSGDPDVRRLDCYVDDVRQENYVAMIDHDGRWSLSVDAGRLGGVEGKHILRIVDANDPEYKLDIDIVLDTVCSLAVDPAYAGAGELTGTADEYADIEVIVDGETYTAEADQAGAFTLQLPRELQLAEKLQVSAVDFRKNAATPVEITVVEQTVAKITLQAVQAGSLVEFSGTAEPGYELGVYQDERVGFTIAGTDGSFESVVPVESLKNGAVIARYVDTRFEKYAGDALEITLDTEAPMLQLDQETIDAADTRISGICTEAATLTVTAGGAELSTAQLSAGGAFEITFDAQPEGTRMTVCAVDGAGNASEALEFIVAPKQQLMILLDAPAPGAQCSYMDDMHVSGYVLSSGKLPAIALQAHDGPMEIETEAAQPVPDEVAQACGAWIDADTCARFWVTLDVSGQPLGEQALQFLNGEAVVEILPAQDETQPTLARSYEIIKPNDYLPVRICILVVLLIGMAVCGVVLGKTSRRLKILKDAELDSNSNISKLTITRRR